MPPRPAPTRLRRAARAGAAAVVAAALGACGGGQDPGVELPASSGPTTTSRTLGTCPPGGPDATTPAAGCLDADGVVQVP